nr:MAG TPA: hypothetical protein [Caudoviricetes sp.]
MSSGVAILPIEPHRLNLKRHNYFPLGLIHRIYRKSVFLLLRYSTGG